MICDYRLTKVCITEITYKFVFLVFINNLIVFF